jgi:YoeB-like toxin of bacterial type II toxin-antitoxin system
MRGDCYPPWLMPGALPPSQCPSRNSVPLSVFEAHFREDLRYWIEQDRKVALKILRLVEAVMRDPFAGEGKPEPLKAWVRESGPGASPRNTGLSIWSKKTAFISCKPDIIIDRLSVPLENALFLK